MNSTIYLSPEILQELYELGYDFDPTFVYYDAEEGFTLRLKADVLANTSAMFSWDDLHKKQVESHKGKSITLVKLSDSGPGWFALLESCG